MKKLLIPCILMMSLSTVSLAQKPIDLVQMRDRLVSHLIEMNELNAVPQANELIFEQISDSDYVIRVRLPDDTMRRFEFVVTDDMLAYSAN